MKNSERVGIAGKTLLVAGALVLAGVGTAHATPSDAQKCAGAKMLATAKYAKCRLGADKKAEVAAEAPDYTKCNEKQLAAWGKAEAKYGAQCPTSGDQATAQSDVTAMTTCLAGNLSTTGSPVGVQVECVACPVGSIAVNGVCWLLSGMGDSCNAACGLAGMAYDLQTETWAGPASNTIAHCAFLLDELGEDNAWLTQLQFGSGPADLGCAVSGQRNLSATATAQGANSFYRRVCACN